MVIYVLDHKFITHYHPEITKFMHFVILYEKQHISLNESVPALRSKGGKTPMHLGLSETAAVLSHQAYEDKTRDSVIERHVQ